MTDAVIAEGLVKRYGDVTALDGLDLRVPEGTVLGPARAERRRQDHGRPHPDHAAARPTRGGAEVAGIDVAEPTPPRCAAGSGCPASTPRSTST